MGRDVELQTVRTRIVELEEGLERTKLRRFGLPAGLGLAGVGVVAMWNVVVPGSLTAGNLAWIAACVVAGFAGLVMNERICRRMSRQLRAELVSSHERLEGLLGRPIDG